MEAKIAVYDSRKSAEKAVERLKETGFPLENVSIIGKVEFREDHPKMRSLKGIKSVPAMAGAVAGTVAGILTGVGLFTIPGFGFLYGAGAIVGAIGGFDIGIIGGGLITIFTSLGIKKDEVLTYEKHLHEGKYILAVHGTQQEIKRAERTLLPTGHLFTNGL